MNKSLGVLCHISCVPSRYGIGDFGAAGKAFVDYLKTTPFTIWQILPLNPTNINNSPYGAMCSFAFDEMFVCPIELCNVYGVGKGELKILEELENTTKVNYDLVKKEKIRLLTLAYNNLSNDDKEKLEAFRLARKDMLGYSYYKVLLEVFNIFDWREIPKKYWDIDSIDAQSFINDNLESINKHLFFQYELHREWLILKDYANKNSIKILGDMIIYLEPNAADIFLNPELVQLDENYNPTVYGGCPPDGFSAEVQNWHTCVWNWEKFEQNDYKQFVDRIKLLLSYYDMLRLDHFIGLVEHFEIYVDESRENKWVKAGGRDLFATIKKECGLDNIIIEDLGSYRQECQDVKDEFELKGMNVLQFAFFDGSEKYLPENATKNSVFYIGTHDNDTFVNFLNSADETIKQRIEARLDISLDDQEEAIIKAMQTIIDCPSAIAVFTIQDLLLQGGDTRMNTPGQAEGCWEYRVPKDYQQALDKTLSKLKL